MKQYKRRDNILAEPLQEHLVMLDIDMGKYFSLNQVATRIWELLGKPKTSEELCQNLIDEFEVDEDLCKREVEEYLNQMLKLKLISVVS